MIRALVLGSLLGFFSGIVPGPFTALIAATALQGGFRAGVWIAVVPLLSETLVLVLAAVFLAQLPEQALRWMGIVGGVFVFYLAWRTWKEGETPPEAEPLTGSPRRMVEGALLAVLSPAPWVFWLLVGAPLFLGAWHEGWGPAAAFLGSFLVFFIGIYLGVAALAGYGRRTLPATWHRRVLRGAAGALVVAGTVLVWQSWVGNFHRMVKGSETIRTLVDDSLLEDGR